ncbi:MAG: T9SS type A sorting domain-containing protein [Flavobacteriales bacterium]|nr:T9SS type A sorting domain-containing protein [Flavobacteriales bacterium]
MYRYLTCATAFVVMTHTANSQCSESDENRVLLVGDSWAFFMGVDQTINTILERWGHSNATFFTNLTIAENGAETDDFLSVEKQTEIQALIDADPAIKVVHLSIGGNDVLGDWHVSFTQAQTDSLRASVEARLIEVIEFIKSTRPDMHVLWSGYAYPNFGEVIEDIAPLQSIHPFYDTWEGMGFPTFEQLNTILNDFSASVGAYCNNDPRVDFVDCTGLMQHTFGQEDPLGVPPGGTYAPLTAPLPHGFVDYPSPQSSMRDYGIFLDCFHLSPSGYRDMIDFHTRKFYHKFLMHDQFMLSEGGVRDGSISSLGEVSNQLMLGELNGVERSTLLSFGTANQLMPTVSAASIFLRRESLDGTNPIGSTVQVRIVNGQFGASAEVEATDLDATSDGDESACRFGSTDGNGHWMRIDLPASLLPFIASNTTTQFVLSLPGATGGMVTFSDASDPDFAPVLDLTFEDISTEVSSVPTSKRNVTVFPNPTSGPVSIDTQGSRILSLELADMMGHLIWRSTSLVNADLSDLPRGAYVLKINTTTGSTMERVVRW